MSGSFRPLFNQDQYSLGRGFGPDFDWPRPPRSSACFVIAGSLLANSRPSTKKSSSLTMSDKVCKVLQNAAIWKLRHLSRCTPENSSHATLVSIVTGFHKHSYFQHEICSGTDSYHKMRVTSNYGEVSNALAFDTLRHLSLKVSFANLFSSGCAFFSLWPIASPSRMWCDFRTASAE